MAELDNGGVKSARRVLELLEYLAESPSGATFPQLIDAFGLPKSSLHGLLGTLVSQGWLYVDEASREYRIGLRAWQVAQSFSRLDLLAQVAHRHLEAVRDELNETVQLAVLEGTDNIYVAKVESDHPLRLVSHVGARLPAYATGLGKVLLAYLDPAELRRRMATVKIEPFTAHTVRTLKALERGLAEIRSRGYGEDEGEYTVGVYCLAVPVVGANGETIAAMSCSVPSARFRGTSRERDALLQALLQNAKALSDELATASLQAR
jgi:DNA-binding IclR family transcriptional regulator